MIEVLGAEEQASQRLQERRWRGRTTWDTPRIEREEGHAPRRSRPPQPARGAA